MSGSIPGSFAFSLLPPSIDCFLLIGVFFTRLRQTDRHLDGDFSSISFFVCFEILSASRRR